MTRPDVAIVGGGIIGCGCAYSLAQLGLSVMVLERDGIAAGASGSCDGHLAIQTKSPGFQAELAAESLELYRRLPDEFAHAAELSPCGSLLIAETPAEVGALEKLADTRRRAGIDLHMLTGSRVRTVEPNLSDGVLAATHCLTDCQANPWRITLWFAGQARSLGAGFKRDVTVTSLQPDADGVLLHTTSGTLQARRVVVAAGAWTSGIAGGLVPQSITPRRGEVLVTERLPRILNGLVISTSYLARKFSTGPADRATLAAEQSAQGNVLIGGTREFVGYDRSVSPPGMRALVERAIRALPVLASAHLIRAFAGLRPFSPDGLPFIGPAPGCDRVIIAAGHEGDGITLAPVTAQIVADLITGQRAPHPLLNPARDVSRAQPASSPADR